MDVEFKSDEKVKWSGNPVIYVVFAATTNGVNFSWIVLAVIILCALYIILRPFMDQRNVTKKSAYFVTDKNVTTFQGSYSSKEMALEDIDEVKIVDKGMTGDVIFGSRAVKRPYSKVRITAVAPMEDVIDDETRVVGLAFYNIKDFEKIAGYLLPGTKITRVHL